MIFNLRATTEQARDAGSAAYDLISALYPVCRSITGDGTRATLRQIGGTVPLAIREIPSGTEVFDWTIPKEWNVRDAHIRNSAGEKVIDFRNSNLHVVGYSIPVNARLTFEELRSHLHTLPDYPDWIPYRTSYYRETWGFCLSEREIARFRAGESYDVLIDSSLEAGHLTYGECFLEGETADEVLVSTHVCHPSLCNDNLSGIAIAAQLARFLSGVRHRYSYRFLFIPGTIGAIAWLARNEGRLANIRHGLVLTCIGDPGPFTYKKSRRATAVIDRAAEHVLRHSAPAGEVLDFSPYGYDERQYCSPAFNLPVGCLMRTPHGCFPEYHTSADNLDLVTAGALADSYSRCLEIFDAIENNLTCVNRSPKCEPQLGKRGLYRSTGGGIDEATLALLWVLNLSDGEHDLLAIAERSGHPFHAIRDAAARLFDAGLLAEARPAAVFGVDGMQVRR